MPLDPRKVRAIPLRKKVRSSSHRAPMYQHHWSLIEHGKRGVTMDIVVRMASALGVDPRELLK